MRTLGTSYAVGLGGALSGWMIAASIGAVQVDSEDTAQNTGQTSPSNNQAGDQREQPELALKANPVIQGPVLEYSYRVDRDQIQTVIEQPDLFAWVYPEYAIVGPLEGDDVMVIPRENLVALRMFDIAENPRQKWRQMAKQNAESPKRGPQEQQSQGSERSAAKVPQEGSAEQEQDREERSRDDKSDEGEAAEAVSEDKDSAGESPN